MHSIERHDLFAVPVWQGILPRFSEQRGALLELVRRERDASPGLRVSNQGGFRSGDTFHLLDADAARYLARAVLQFGVGALRSHVGGFVGQDLALTDCWANVDGPGHWHTPHCHYPAAWSGVVYVATEGSVATEQDDRSGKVELLCPLPAPQAFGQPTGVTITPRDGMILLFPGVLQHMVHPHRGASERVSIAFNMNVVPRA